MPFHNVIQIWTDYYLHKVFSAFTKRNWSEVHLHKVF